jgi:hypothetical protein
LARGAITNGLVWGNPAFVLLLPASDVTRLIDTFVCFQLSVSLHRIGISHRLQLFFFVLLNLARLHRVFRGSLRLQPTLTSTTDALRKPCDKAEL